MRHQTIHLIAQTLCECDGKNWMEILPTERDRYARIAILVDHRMATEAGQPDEDRALDHVLDVGWMKIEGRG